MSIFSSPFLLAGVICAFLVHVAAMYLAPLQTVLNTAPVSFQTGLVMMGLALTVFIAIELHKVSWRLRGYTP
jgi:Ca2+-transporting ATPase